MLSLRHIAYDRGLHILLNTTSNNYYQRYQNKYIGNLVTLWPRMDNQSLAEESLDVEYGEQNVTDNSHSNPAIYSNNISKNYRLRTLQCNNTQMHQLTVTAKYVRCACWCHGKSGWKPRWESEKTRKQLMKEASPGIRVLRQGLKANTDKASGLNSKGKYVTVRQGQAQSTSGLCKEGFTKYSFIVCFIAWMFQMLQSLRKNYLAKQDRQSQTKTQKQRLGSWETKSLTANSSKACN